MALRNIQVGDNLSGVTLFFDFNDLSYSILNEVLNGSSSMNILKGSSNFIEIQKYTKSGVNAILIRGYISGRYSNAFFDVDENEVVYKSERFYNCPNTFGEVTRISQNIVFDCIKISIHEKVYAYCENYCMEETMTKEQILESCVLNQNMLLLTGQMSVGTSSSTSSINYTVKEINYPEGWNKDNCVLLSVGTTTHDSGELHYGVLNDPYFSYNYSEGLVPVEVSLKSDCIRLYFGNITSNALYLDYKILLIKVS